MTGRQDANRHRYQLMTLIVLYTGFGPFDTEKDILGTNVTPGCAPLGVDVMLCWVSC